MSDVRCSCCGEPAPRTHAHQEWGFCSGCREAGCYGLGDGDISRGMWCPLLVAQAKCTAAACDLTPPDECGRGHAQLPIDACDGVHCHRSCDEESRAECGVKHVVRLVKLGELTTDVAVARLMSGGAKAQRQFGSAEWLLGDLNRKANG